MMVYMSMKRIITQRTWHGWVKGRHRDIHEGLFAAVEVLFLQRGIKNRYVMIIN